MVTPPDYLRGIIAYYLQRQTLVVLAMLDLNPKSLSMAGQSIVGIRLQPYLDRYMEKEGKLEDILSLQRGIWKNEWHHWVHGIGCRLTHVSTGEPLEWDAPDVKSFRFDWFWQHFMWRCQFDTNDPYIAITKQWIHISPNKIEQIAITNDIIKTGIDGLAHLTEP